MRVHESDISKIISFSPSGNQIYLICNKNNARES